MELAVIIIGAILGMAMSLAIVYVLYFNYLPMVWRLYRDTRRRQREKT